MSGKEHGECSQSNSELAANRLQKARLDAGFLSANHAAITFGWSIKTYSLHEEGAKHFDKDTAKKYSKAFNIDGDWLSSLCEDFLIKSKAKVKNINDEEEKKRREQQATNKRKLVAAKRLRLAREDAGYHTANHAAMRFRWNMKVYLQHEIGTKFFDEETALKYARAFNVGDDWFSIDDE
ncbi:MAG: XRE family transcriptional regulator [Methylocystaceae bacterium]|nr:XRE family transcriptional regulator [Methylocystaceae bacterium]